MEITAFLVNLGLITHQNMASKLCSQLCTEPACCLDLSQEDEKNFKFPHAPGFLEYVKNRQVVTFKKLENPKVRHPPDLGVHVLCWPCQCLFVPIGRARV
jgi:hypothetical protein